MAYLSSIVIAITVAAICICLIFCSRRRATHFTSDEKRMKGKPLDNEMCDVFIDIETEYVRNNGFKETRFNSIY